MEDDIFEFPEKIEFMSDEELRNLNGWSKDQEIYSFQFSYTRDYDLEDNTWKQKNY